MRPILCGQLFLEVPLMSDHDQLYFVSIPIQFLITLNILLNEFKPHETRSSTPVVYQHILYNRLSQRPALFTVRTFKLHTSPLTLHHFSAVLSSTLQVCIFSSLTWLSSSEGWYALTSTLCHHNRPAAFGTESTICSSLL